MKDIARDLGVSLMTVSKALRNHSDISEKTRARVLKRMKELNYQPDWIARSLVTRRTYLVGLVIPDLMHSFFAEVAKGVARRLEPGGYHVVIFNSEENPEAETRQIDLLLQRKVDGLIVASAHRNGDAEIFRKLFSRDTPCVLIDRLFSGIQVNYVGVKDEEVGAMATAHLIERGCRRIAHIRGPAVPPGIGRLKGYRPDLWRGTI
jgi:LacI family transcriptional regulator